MTDWHGRESVDLGTELLDRQIVDPDGVPVGQVDDVVLRARDDGRLEVAALVTGVAALERRLPRWARWCLRAATRPVGGLDEPRHIDMAEVTDAGVKVTVTRAGAAAGASPAQDRIRRRIIARIPGSGHASG